MKFLVAVSFLALTEGFVPNKPLSARFLNKQSNTRTYKVSEIVKDIPPAEPFQPNDLKEDALFAEDLGKEIFISNLSESSKVVSSTDFDVIPVITEDQQPALPVDDASLVSDILAASEEAVHAAEAALPLADQLEFQDKEGFKVVEPVAEAPITEILPASSVVGEPATKIDAPRVSKILKFAVPAIGVWLCGPLLSLIDTSSVGLLSGTAQQAALNPAVAVTDYAALLIAFLYTATTNLMAAARETDHGVEGMPRTSRTFIGAMQLSGYVGVGLGAILFAFARPLLRAIIGNDGISPEVFAAAMKYVRIRSLGMPAAAVIGSAQAACLGMQDIRSPLYVLGVAAAVNFMGDMIFVGSGHPLIGGAAGAAWATVFSQYAAVTMFIHWLCNKAKPKVDKEAPSVDVSNAILELTGNPKSKGEGRRRKFRDALRTFNGKFRASSSKELPKAVQPKEENFSVRGFLQNKFGALDLIKVPSKDTFKQFAEYVVPVTSTQVGRVSGYVAMSHVVSSSLGMMSMAAQQILVSFFYCLCPIADSLSLTAQSFLPAINEKKDSPAKSKALREAAFNFAKAGAIFGGVMFSAVGAMPVLSRFFTTDLQVIGIVNRVAPLLLAFFSVHGVVCAMEGVLLGRKDLSFLGRMYAGYFAVVPWFMLRVKRAALTGSAAVNLNSVWKVMVGYQLFRLFAWSGRAALLQRRAERVAAP